MAIGADTSIRAPRPSPFTPPASQPAKPQAAPRRQLAINDSAVADMQNNQMAQGVGAGAVALQGMDRAGISRGKGQQYMANLAEAASQSDASLAAQKTGALAGFADASAQRAYENTQANERLGYGGLLEGLRNTGAMEGIGRRGLQQNIIEAMRRGQFGLDQLQLDTSPLLASLLQQ